MIFNRWWNVFAVKCTSLIWKETSFPDHIPMKKKHFSLNIQESLLYINIYFIYMYTQTKINHCNIYIYVICMYTKTKRLYFSQESVTMLSRENEMLRANVNPDVLANMNGRHLSHQSQVSFLPSRFLQSY